ncbi:mCG1047796 [Mus musculus]|nr:mCG1047796 [Mus musculus]
MPSSGVETAVVIWMSRQLFLLPVLGLHRSRPVHSQAEGQGSGTCL